MTSGTRTTDAERTRAIDELASLVRPIRRFAVNRSAEIVVGIAVLATVLGLLALAGAAVDDRAISANPGYAQADVLDGSTFARTVVRFTVASGETVVPEHGVFYPSGLQVGQSVAVEYDLGNPELVRVAGSSAFGEAGPLALALAAVWAVLGPLALWLRRRRHAGGANGTSVR
ncbi:DUF3592 domain-containing protein [Pseudonocardia adelaidensis]|uniref:DUF3592 domain-containing protein n=1 Tax=Pseudonocardia adelaidensis TaxID=648754 RepID=UPI0031E65680